MRKILLSVVACCAVIALVPASALAHGHHKRHHRAHHARVRDFGSTTSSSSSSGGSSQDQPAGTIQSISGNAVTIALTGGGTVTGNVTGDTEIECQAADMSGSSSWQGLDHGGDNNSTGSGDNNQGDDDQGQGDDDNNNAQSCGMPSLTQGAVVQEAELMVSSAGSTWKKIDLAPTSSSSSSSSSDS
jgi:hypothetical protein